VVAFKDLDDGPSHFSVSGPAVSGVLEPAVAVAALFVTVTSGSGVGTKLVSVMGAVCVIIRGIGYLEEVPSSEPSHGLKRAFI
jgi:hypothetical protein